MLNTTSARKDQITTAGFKFEKSMRRFYCLFRSILDL
jgi:hypothetical protein